MTVIAVLPTAVNISIRAFGKFLDSYVYTGIADTSRIGIYNNTEKKDKKFITSFVTKALRKSSAIAELVEETGLGIMTFSREVDGEVEVELQVMLDDIDSNFEGSREEYLCVVLNEIAQVIINRADYKGILAEIDEATAGTFVEAAW